MAKVTDTRRRQQSPGEAAAVTGPAGPAEVYSIRLAPAVHAETLRAAKDSGLAWATWAARQLAAAAASTAKQPRFGTLEDVLGMQLGRGDVERLAAGLGPVLLGDPALLRGAIAAAWATGRGPEIRAACEQIGLGESPGSDLSPRQLEILLAIHRNRPYDAGRYQPRVLESLTRRGLIEHTSIGWRTTARGEELAGSLERP